MQTSLKTLSRQYASGTLSKEEYRRARMDLLEAAQENDETQPHTTMPFQPVAALQQTSSASNDEIEAVPEGQPSPPTSKKGISPTVLMVVLAGVILLAVVLGSLML